MNRADKRNFKLLAQITGGDKKYLKLFDVLDRQAEYDERKLAAFQERERSGSQLSVAKHYLYNSILRSLAYFHRSDSEDGNALSLQIRILVEKNLSHHATKLLRKAKAEARDTENFQELLSLLAIERSIATDGNDPLALDDRLLALQSEEKAASAALSECVSYQERMDKVFLILHSSMHLRNPDDLKRFQEVLGGQDMHPDARPGSHRARILFHSIHRQFAAFSRRHAAAVVEGERVLAEFEAKPALKEVMAQEYLAAMHGAGEAMLMSGQLDAAKAMRARLEAQELRSSKAVATRFELSFRLGLAITIMSGDVPMALALLLRLHDGWADMKPCLSVSARMWLGFEAARACLIAARPREALRWINQFLNDEPRVEHHSDLQCYIRLLNLMVHVELGNLDLVEHSLVSTYRFIFKRQRIFQAERSVLRHIKTLSQSEEAIFETDTWVEILEDVGKVEEIEQHRPAVETLMLRAWAEQRVLQVPMAECQARAYQSRNAGLPYGLDQP